MAWTPLHQAAKEGKAETIMSLLDGGARFEDKDAKGATALHWALAFGALNGPMDSAHLLLEARACVETRGADGKTPLQWAVQTGSTHAAQVLLLAKADVQVRSTDGFTPLEQARRMGHGQIVELLEQADCGIVAGSGFRAVRSRAIVDEATTMAPEPCAGLAAYPDLFKHRPSNGLDDAASQSTACE
eukprot:TRINITY_DN15728_c0_g1_i1.p1 TRINITY_DN15728_c0_g1~~TRINITY_DN15728_c0_g1_i1.p1  ORF type:complete len:200 (-),score=55.17 TRINITY_DN15728_c0_g1_i1:113-673(-)